MDHSRGSAHLYGRTHHLTNPVLLDTGDLDFVALRRVRTHRNAGRRWYRWYNDYRLPDWAGGGTLTVRLHGNDEDERRGLNRTENVRPIPATDPDFAALYARRNDAESINRHLDDTLWLGRAHSVGHARQHLNLLGFALCVNSVASTSTANAEPRPSPPEPTAPGQSRWLRRARRATRSPAMAAGRPTGPRAGLLRTTDPLTGHLYTGDLRGFAPRILPAPPS